MTIHELIVLTPTTDAKMQEDQEIFALFNEASAIHYFGNRGFYYSFRDQGWYDVDQYAKIDKRLSFLCSLDLEDYAYIRVEPDEDPVYGGDVLKFGLQVEEIPDDTTPNS